MRPIAPRGGRCSPKAACPDLLPPRPRPGPGGGGVQLSAIVARRPHAAGLGCRSTHRWRCRLVRGALSVAGACGRRQARSNACVPRATHGPSPIPVLIFASDGSTACVMAACVGRRLDSDSRKYSCSSAAFTFAMCAVLRGGSMAWGSGWHHHRAARCFRHADSPAGCRTGSQFSKPRGIPYAAALCPLVKVL